MPGRKNRTRAASAAAGGAIGNLNGRREAVTSESLMVSVVLAGLEPGVTVGGLKLADAPVGSPVTAKLMAVSNAPFCGVAVMV